MNAEMLLANQIARFSSFNISKTIGVIKLIFSIKVDRYLLKLQIDVTILGGHGQAYPKRLLKLSDSCDLFESIYIRK